ncbi:hypothetical protein [Streptomyces sp. NBC_01304]|uniref:hypothetical protein n=1 Tax=Streptomyces sp. NBC_01304 TaxID=2903818 RepID=UPI002E12D02D|nr:hypothetical protein OG430_01915 [Streptomyces sp. NBC_01304]
MRYPGDGWDRLHTGGCPFYDEDLDWARGLIDEMGSALRNVAADHGTGSLDLREALRGHTVCSDKAKLVTQGTPKSRQFSEWARFVASGRFEGDMNESIHPNAFGQRALGKCLAGLYGTDPQGGARLSGACTATAGKGYDGVTVAR